MKAPGFEVVYADGQHLKGSVKPTHVGDLLGDWNTEKLQFVEILEAAQMLQQAEQNLAEQEVKLKQQEEKVTKFKREDAGLRFTIRSGERRVGKEWRRKRRTRWSPDTHKKRHKKTESKKK